MKALPKSRFLVAAESVLLAVIVAALAVLWARKREPAPGLRPAGPPRAAQPAPAVARPEAAPVARVEREAAKAPAEKVTAYAHAFDALSGDSRQNPLHLTADQIDALRDCYGKLYESRLELEARLAKTETVDGGGVFIEIPAYPDEGKTLEQGFLSALSEKFGEPLAGAIAEQYLQTVETANANLGRSTQQFLISPDPEAPGRMKLVYSTASAEDSAHDTETLNGLTEENLREIGPLALLLPKP